MKGVGREVLDLERQAMQTSAAEREKQLATLTEQARADPSLEKRNITSSPICYEK